MSLKLKLVLCEKLLLSDNSFLETNVNLLHNGFEKAYEKLCKT